MSREAMEYSQTKCLDRAAVFATRFQLAWVHAASNTASNAARGIQISMREERAIVYGDDEPGNGR